MYYTRRILLSLMLVNILFLALYDGVPTILKIFRSTDDWQYKTIRADYTQQIVEYAQACLWYLLTILIVCELMRVIFAGGKAGRRALLWGSAAAVAFLLYSISGPMVCNNTDRSAQEYGFATGGAKDINNFRANIIAGLLPQASDITYEGLFYDYCFNIGRVLPKTGPDKRKLFAPTWSSSTSKNPLSGQTEHFLAIGLKSQLRGNELARKKLNLVVVFDISGENLQRQ